MVPVYPIILNPSDYLHYGRMELRILALPMTTPTMVSVRSLPIKLGLSRLEQERPW